MKRTHLKWKTPLKRHWTPKAQAKVERRTPLKKISKSRARRLAEYYPIRDAFLAAHPVCAVCLCQGRQRPNKATEVHHIRGRAGKLLADPRFFAASCREYREVPHANPAWAREVGLLAPVGEWNVYPR